VSYIKISDPNIIDLAAWHQVINVINQHSDSLAAITNNFGVSSSVTWDAAGYAHQYDPASQAIIFGRASNRTADSGVAGVYYGSVTFADSATGTNSFSGTPIVTATIFTGNATTVAATLEDVVINVYNVSSTGFKYRLFKTGTGTTDTTHTISSGSTIYINWMAIGPRLS